MKIKSVLLLLILIFSLAQEVSFGQNTTNESAPVKMGVSQIDITPDNPTVMGGYGFRTTVSKGVRDHLYASALYFSGDKTQVLIITADLLGFTTDFADDLRNVISSKIGISSEHIFISAVLMHGGPVTRYYETDSLHTVEAYPMILKQKLTMFDIDATKNLIPVQMGIGNMVCNTNITKTWIRRGQIKVCRFADLINYLI